MKRCLLIIVILSGIFPSINLRAQFYVTGQPPGSIKWKKITTDHFNLVFPETMIKDAGRMANLLEYYYPLTMGDLKHTMKKRFPILIHSSSVLSNGYVALTPKRMEIVATPPQNSYAQDWLSQLTLHEFRHTVQLNKLNQGFTKVFGWFTGEIAQGIVSAQIPSWFYEGDAVYNETVHSGAGRGRIPGFDMGLRTLLMNKTQDYSYNKAIFGSFRNYVPDHYQYGYHMVSHARDRFGNAVWSEALDFTARNPFLIWPLALHFKRNFGIYNSGLYKLTIDSLKREYINQMSTFTYSNYISTNHQKNKIYTNYTHPEEFGKGLVVALKSGLSESGSIILIDSMGYEKKLTSIKTGFWQNTDIFENLLIWDETETDPRWEKRDYSVIKVFDIVTGKKRNITRKTRFFSPDFSPDGKRIAVVESNHNNENFLTIIDAGNGEILNRIPACEKQWVMPEWASETEIIVISVGEKGKQIECIDLETGKWKVYMSYTFADIAEPVNYGNFVLFRASFHPVENIYAISKSDAGSVYQVTTSLTGAWHPAITRDHQELLFSEYSHEGFNVSKITIDTSLWVMTFSGIQNEIPTESDHHYERVPEIAYTVEDYHKSAHLFNFHSWLPFYADIEAIRDDPADIFIKPGFIFFSQNLLSTVISTIGYSNEHGYHHFHPSIQWRAWYPVIELSADIGGPQKAISLPEGINVSENAFPYSNLRLRTYIPLFYQRGNHTAYLQPGIEYQRSSEWYYENGLKRGIDFTHFRIHAGRFSRMALRDLYPRWGQSIAVTYTVSPAERDLFGNLFSFQLNTFFPGFFRHHHFIARGGIQVQHTQTYYMAIKRIEFPRGYVSSVSREFAGLMFNYSFPAGYPDLSVGSLLYLKRLRANLFYDLSYGRNIREISPEGADLYTGSYESYGTEILADIHLFRLIFPLAAGVRIGYIPGRERFFTEFIMSINTRNF